MHIALIATELAFLLVLLAGLVTRYGLAGRGSGSSLLVATPAIDLVLLVAATVDLRRGGEAMLPHALAAVYIGVSIAWGPRLIDWADARFARSPDLETW